MNRSTNKSNKRRANETDLAVGGRIRAFRIQEGMSQTDLANVIGLTFQQVQKYESGANRISAGRLAQVAVVVNQPVAAFFDDRNDLPPGHGGDREALELLRSFRSLPSRELRNQVRRLVGIVAETAAETAPSRRPRKAA